MYLSFLRSMGLSLLLIMISSIALAQTQVHTNYEQMDTIQAPFEEQSWYNLKGKQVEYDSLVLISDKREAVKVKVKDIPRPKEGELQVNAYVEDENSGIKSDVDCEVKNDTVICSW